MQRWPVAPVVLVPLVLLSGCSAPDDRFPPWAPSDAPGGPQAIANGTFQFVEVSGTVRERGAEPLADLCSRVPPNADVDEERRRLVLDRATMDAWNPAANLVVRDTVRRSGDGTGCDGAALVWPRPELHFQAQGSTMALSMHVLPLVGGPAIGPSLRVLEEGVPYRHRVHWQEVDPSTGEEREFVLDATFLYRGVWSWADAEVGLGTTHWAH